VEFLRELTARHASLLVWKHLDRALQGQGDVDAAAPVADVAALRGDATSIAARTLAASHVILCDHIADKSLHFFVQPDRLPQLFEFDICTQPSRGLAPWARPDLMLPLATMSAEGIRRLRPGAEAVVSLVYHGLSPSGAPRLTGSVRTLVEVGLAEDRAGAHEACASLPPRAARRPLAALVETVSCGGWDRRLARRAYVGFALAACAHPRFAVRRLGLRAGLATGRECVMSRLARREGRRVPPSGVDALLRAARADGHVVIAL
jgi:hypothetical protein